MPDGQRQIEDRTLQTLQKLLFAGQEDLCHDASVHAGARRRLQAPLPQYPMRPLQVQDDFNDMFEGMTGLTGFDMVEEYYCDF